MFSSVFGDVNKTRIQCTFTQECFMSKFFCGLRQNFSRNCVRDGWEANSQFHLALCADTSILGEACPLIDSRETSTDDLKNFKKPKGTEVLRNWWNSRKSHIHMYAWDTYMHTWTHRSAVWHSLLYFGTRAPGMSGAVLVLATDTTRDSHTDMLPFFSLSPLFFSSFILARQLVDSNTKRESGLGA